MCVHLRKNPPEHELRNGITPLTHPVNAYGADRSQNTKNIEKLFLPVSTSGSWIISYTMNEDENKYRQCIGNNISVDKIYRQNKIDGDELVPGFNNVDVNGNNITPTEIAFINKKRTYCYTTPSDHPVYVIIESRDVHEPQYVNESQQFHMGVSSYEALLTFSTNVADLKLPEIRDIVESNNIRIADVPENILEKEIEKWIKRSKS